MVFNLCYLTQQAVKDAPPYDSAAMPDREQEAHVHDHYGRTGYWATEPVPGSARMGRLAEVGAAAASLTQDHRTR